jgi:ABC-type xylose transport system permease subunit
MKKKSFRTEREFGLIVGGIFVLLSSWWIYRGKFPSVRYVTLPLGALLVVLGILIPRSLVYPNKAWMPLAEALSFVSTRIILAIVYFLVLTPIGVIKRLFGWDPLHRRESSRESYWRPYSERQRDTRHYEKMY